MQLGNSGGCNGSFSKHTRIVLSCPKGPFLSIFGFIVVFAWGLHWLKLGIHCN